MEEEILSQVRYQQQEYSQAMSLETFHFMFIMKISLVFHWRQYHIFAHVHLHVYAQTPVNINTHIHSTHIHIKIMCIDYYGTGIENRKLELFMQRDKQLTNMNNFINT